MKTQFILHGSGWRAEFFLRVAKALPDKFEISAVVTTNEEKAQRFTQEFGVKCCGSMEEALALGKPHFVVVSVNASANVDVSLAWLGAGVPVLLETPPAPNLDALAYFRNAMLEGAKIQIAEQYPFQPMFQARLAFIKSGKLGELQHAQVSYTHGFHAVALIRKLLGVGLVMPKITATSFPVSVVGGYTREGEPTQEHLLQKKQTIAVLDFGGKTGLLNFETDQHRSWVRSSIIQVKGTRGEIFNHKIKYLQDYKTPMESDLIRKTLGQEDNFEGYDLKGIIGGDEWLYRNPYQGARLVDDEIAVATLLDKMAEYVQGGEPFYSFEEAAFDMQIAAEL